jgi:hypothetical protein
MDHLLYKYASMNDITKGTKVCKQNNSNVLPKLINPDLDYVTKLNFYKPHKIETLDPLESSISRFSGDILEHLRNINYNKSDVSSRKETIKALIENSAEEELKEMNLKLEKMKNEIMQLYSKLEYYKKYKEDALIDIELFEKNILKMPSLLITEKAAPVQTETLKRRSSIMKNGSYAKRKSSLVNPEEIQEFVKMTQQHEVYIC